MAQTCRPQLLSPIRSGTPLCFSKPPTAAGPPRAITVSGIITPPNDDVRTSFHLFSEGIHASREPPSTQRASLTNHSWRWRGPPPGHHAKVERKRPSVLASWDRLYIVTKLYAYSCFGLALDSTIPLNGATRRRPCRNATRYRDGTPLLTATSRTAFSYQSAINVKAHSGRGTDRDSFTEKPSAQEAPPTCYG